MASITKKTAHDNMKCPITFLHTNGTSTQQPGLLPLLGTKSWSQCTLWQACQNSKVRHHPPDLPTYLLTLPELNL